MTTGAEQATRQTGAVQRRGKFSGAPLAQTVVLGWLAAPEWWMAVPAGAVRLLDVGAFAVAQLAEWMAAGAPFVSRLTVGTAVVTSDGQR